MWARSPGPLSFQQVHRPGVEVKQVKQTQVAGRGAAGGSLGPQKLPFFLLLCLFLSFLCFSLASLKSYIYFFMVLILPSSLRWHAGVGHQALVEGELREVRNREPDHPSGRTKRDTYNTLNACLWNGGGAGGWMDGWTDEF